jgi:hypothetical protein
MPIRPENQARYPADWAAISKRIRFDRANGRCECDGRCARPLYHLAGDGRCVNVNGAPAVGTGSRVVLTVAHLDHTPENCADDNLKAMCQGCHLHYDREHHAETRARTRASTKQKHETALAKRYNDGWWDAAKYLGPHEAPSLIVESFVDRFKVQPRPWLAEMGVPSDL